MNSEHSQIFFNSPLYKLDLQIVGQYLILFVIFLENNFVTYIASLVLVKPVFSLSALYRNVAPVRKVHCLIHISFIINIYIFISTRYHNYRHNKTMQWMSVLVIT